MGKCSAVNCSSATYHKTPGITFHRFPKNEDLKKVWVQNLKRKDWQPNSNSVLCSKHFEHHLLDSSEFCTRLRPGSIPTLFLEFPENTDVVPQAGVAKKRSAAGHIVLVPEKETIDVKPSTSKDIIQEFLGFPEDKENLPKVQIAPSSATGTGHITSILAEQKNLQNKIEPEPSSSKYSVFSRILQKHTQKLRETAPESKLKEKLVVKNRKIKCLQERNRRMKKKVKQYSDIIADLRKKLNEEQMSILSNIPVKNKDFMIRYMKKTQGASLEKSYPPEIRSFALQLNFYSARAYNHVRSQFNTVLPHPTTISRWYKKINAQPGFTSESFKTLKTLSDNNTHKTIVNLSIDEMAIKKEQVWDRAHSKFRGHVDTGTEVCDDSLPLATQALVLMVTAINACWKLPIAYFFITSMTGEQRANIVKIAIDMLYEINIFVRGITFDGAASNISMATNLGCNFNFNSLAPYFYFKDLKIYAFYDPCHMIKLIRNCLGDFKIIIDKDGNSIKFQYFTILQNIAEKKGVHLGVKIRKAHIYFQKQKMKVRLAAQLFSKSVADALVFCKDVLKMDEFKDCGATIKFVNIVNECFDILNSRSTLAPGSKKALCAANIDRVKEFVRNFVCLWISFTTFF